MEDSNNLNLESKNYKTSNNKYTLACLIYFIPNILSIIIEKTSATDSADDTLTNISYSTLATGMFVGYLIWFVPLIMIFSKELGIAFSSAVSNQAKIVKTFLSIPIIFVIGWALQIVANLSVSGLESALNLVTESTSENQQILEDMLTNAGFLPLVLLIFSIVVMGPLVEELIFRRTIFVLLARKNIVIAFVISSLLFGLIHVVSAGDYLYIIPYFVMGLTFAGAYQFSKNIWTPIILHMLWNAFSVVLIFIL